MGENYGCEYCRRRIDFDLRGVHNFWRDKKKTEREKIWKCGMPILQRRKLRGLREKILMFKVAATMAWQSIACKFRFRWK